MKNIKVYGKMRRYSKVIAMLSTCMMLGACGGQTTDAVPETQAEDVQEEEGSDQQEAVENNKDDEMISEDAGDLQSTQEDSQENVAGRASVNDGVVRVDLTDAEMVEYSSSGIIYQDSEGKYGIVSLDGKNDTGAVYSEVSNDHRYRDTPNYGYYIVTTDFSEKTDSADSMNRYGIVDAHGRQILAEEYGYIRALNENYAAAAKFGDSSNENDSSALPGRIPTSSFYLDDIIVWYKADWQVYDIQTGKEVPGATGKGWTIDDLMAFGGYVNIGDSWYDSSSNVDKDGNPVPEEATFYLNGTYSITEPMTAAVYDSDGSVIFTYDPNEYEVICDGKLHYETYRALKSNGESAALDENGNIISCWFTDRNFNVYGNYVIKDKQLMDLDGNVVVEGIFSAAKHCIDDYWLYFDASSCDFAIADSDGNIIISGKSYTDEISMLYCIPYKYDSNTYSSYYYSFTDKDYTLAGDYEFYYGLIRAENNGGKYDVIDAFTGETVLRGYDNYYAVEEIDGSVTIIAVANGRYADIYTEW